MLYRGDRAAEVLAAYAEWLADVPEEMTTLAAFLTAPPAPFVPGSLQFQPAFAILLCHVGDLAAGQAVLEPLRASCPPDADAVGPMPYPVLQGMLDAGAPHGQRNYWKSGYLSELGSGLQAVLVAAAGRMPTPFDQIHLHQLGGAAATKTAGAIGHRAAAFAVNVIGAGFEPEHDAPNAAWVRETWSAVEPATSGAYVNFLAGDDTDRVRSAYGTAAVGPAARGQAGLGPRQRVPDQPQHPAGLVVTTGSSSRVCRAQMAPRCVVVVGRTTAVRLSPPPAMRPI